MKIRHPDNLSHNCKHILNLKACVKKMIKDIVNGQQETVLLRPNLG